MVLLNNDGRVLLNMEKSLKKKLIKAVMPPLILSFTKANGKVWGYRFIDHLHVEFGTFISPGTVYPQLDLLGRHGLIKPHTEDGESFNQQRVAWTLTKKGEEKESIWAESRLLTRIVAFLKKG